MGAADGPKNGTMPQGVLEWMQIEIELAAVRHREGIHAFG
ncbi:hypothetical protein CGMCC3_g12710 [Colletotrichum fructicola]|nr:uncharacterized protein CGMCC3_g12710 [Colletotrichum fructicola]KAE9571119.1 hypothetical protein CGMCC3_g12710 [Colletotrichum fructicola]